MQACESSPFPLLPTKECWNPLTPTPAQQSAGVPVSTIKTRGQRHKGRHVFVAFSYFSIRTHSCKTEWAGPIRTPGLPGSQETVVISGGLANKWTLLAGTSYSPHNSNLNLQCCVQLRCFNVFKRHRNSPGELLAHFLNWKSSES